jgi:hypothetical protein
MEHDPAPRSTGAEPSVRWRPGSTGPSHSSAPVRHRSSSPRLVRSSRPQVAPEPSSYLRPQFRLRPGPDDALIRWLSSLSPRQRSRAIRAALCEYLAGQHDDCPAEWREDPDLAHALDSLF